MRRAAPPAVPDDPAEARKAAYVTALRWLAGREMSAARIRERLGLRGFTPDVVEDTLARLTGNGAVDDTRAALSAARSLVAVRLRGRHRASRELERLGFGKDVAAEALGTILSEVDESAVAARLVRSRLRGRKTIADAADYKRIFDALLRRGFPSDLIRAAMEPYWRRGDGEEEGQ